MPETGDDGGAERFTDGLNEQARLYQAQITAAAVRFVTHNTRMTINQDRSFVGELATLLHDDSNWLPFESACRQALGPATRVAGSALTADLRTLKEALEAVWLTRLHQQQREQVHAETGDGHGRALPKGIVVPQQQLNILIPPTVGQISAVVSRIVKASNRAGIQLLSTGSTLMANTLSSEIVGTLDYRLQPGDVNLTLILMLNECLFSKELGENVNTSMPPQSVVAAVHDLMLQQLPRLVTQTAIPWLNDSEIVSDIGYHRKGIWYQPINGGFQFPATPTQDEMEGAVERVRDIYCGGFKFAAEADKANVIGSAIMNIVQPGLNGRSPLVMVTKPEPRTGGTYLATILAMTGQGRMVDPKAWPKNEEERQKNFFAALRARPSAVFYDNVSGVFEGDAAALMCSSPRFSDRVLGISTIESGDIRACLFAAANNVEVSHELAERINFINLEAFVDDVERETYRNGRPSTVEEWLEPCHKPAVEALLTMVAWWLNNGRPRGQRVLPGFNQACSVVGGILTACGVEGWLGNRSAAEMSRVLDQREDESLPVIRLIWQIEGSNMFRPADLLADWLAEDREVELPIRTNDNPNAATRAIRLGWWLRQRMGRWWSLQFGLATPIKVRIVKAPDNNVGSRWFLEQEHRQTTLDV
jgi:hypothetical protein